MLEDRINARIAELQQMEHAAHRELVAIRTALAELAQIVAPAPIVTRSSDTQEAPPHDPAES